MKRFRMRGRPQPVLRFEQFTVWNSGKAWMPRWRRRGQ